MSDSSVPSEQSGTQAFPIVISSAPAESPAPTDLAVGEPSEAALLVGELTSDQQRVLQLLGTGTGISAASRSTGVPLRTVSRWVHRNPKFIAALNAWKSEQLQSGKASALAMTDLVMSALRSGIEQGNTNIAFRMAREMGLLEVSKPGPTDADEIERRREIRRASRQQRLLDLEHEHDLDLRDRAERQEIAWSKRALRRLSPHEQTLLKFLQDKAAGREKRDCSEFSPLDRHRLLTDWERRVLIKARQEAILEGNILFHGHVLPTPRGTNGTLIHFSKREMFDMLRKGGVAEDEAMQLLANYRRPYPGFLAPNDLPYAEDEETAHGSAIPADATLEQPAEPAAEQTGLQEGSQSTAAQSESPATNA